MRWSRLFSPALIVVVALWAILIFILFLGLKGCATAPTADEETIRSSSSPLIMTPEGERPAVCYVRAKHFAGLVPISCEEANQARP